MQGCTQLLDAKSGWDEIFCNFAFKKQGRKTNFIIQHHTDHHTDEDL